MKNLKQIVYGLGLLLALGGVSQAQFSALPVRSPSATYSNFTTLSLTGSTTNSTALFYVPLTVSNIGTYNAVISSNIATWYTNAQGGFNTNTVPTMISVVVTNTTSTYIQIDKMTIINTGGSTGLVGWTTANLASNTSVTAFRPIAPGGTVTYEGVQPANLYFNGCVKTGTVSLATTTLEVEFIGHPSTTATGP